MARKNLETRICTVDLETDPFLKGRKPEPFALGFFDGESYVDFWGDDCVQQWIDYLPSLDYRAIVYAHNGGKFDFLYMLPFLCQEPFIINRRIVKANIYREKRQSKHSHVELRDSYAILPFPLSHYDKIEIDMAKFEREVREENREEIRGYLKRDCTALWELVHSFHAKFGDCLTVATAAMRELEKFHKWHPLSVTQDVTIRPYYFGGRCEAFKTGTLRGSWKIYDVNSMYPYVMKNYLHPIGHFQLSPRVGKDTCFITWEGYSKGHMPVRDSKGLSFPVGSGTFHSTIHEFDAAKSLDLIMVKRVLECYDCSDRITFAEFIDHFYAARMLAKKSGDKIGTIFYKLIMNSSYGKFAMNPDNFEDWALTQGQILTDPWVEKFYDGNHDLYWYSKPAETRPGRGLLNVGTAASITGAARSVLMRAITMAENPAYCDTDSLICEALPLEQSDTALGAWKIEASGNTLFVAGKKLYALFDEKIGIKKAHKGAQLTYDDVKHVAEGGTVRWSNDAPCMDMAGNAKFIARNIRRTAVNKWDVFAQRDLVDSLAASEM